HAHDAVAEPFLQVRKRDRTGDSAGQRCRWHQRAYPAILGDHVDTVADRLRGAAALPATTVEPYLTAGEIFEAVEAAQQAAFAGAERAGDSDDLTDPYVEVERRCLRDQSHAPQR